MGTRHTRYRQKNVSHLLPLFKFQLDSRLDTVARVLVGLLQGELHEMLVVRARQVPTDENDHVGQDLERQKEPLRRASLANSGAQHPQKPRELPQETSPPAVNFTGLQTHIFIDLKKQLLPSGILAPSGTHAL